MSKLTNAQTMELLINNPTYINEIDTLSLDGECISLVLIDHPQLFDKFDLSLLDGFEISCLLREQPQLANLFDLSRLNGYDISLLLRNQPQFKDVFNCVIVPDAGINSRTLFIKKDEPSIIHLGCFNGTKEEAIQAIKQNRYYYNHTEERDLYISKVEECFKLL